MARLIAKLIVALFEIGFLALEGLFLAIWDGCQYAAKTWRSYRGETPIIEIDVWRSAQKRHGSVPAGVERKTIDTDAEQVAEAKELIRSGLADELLKYHELKEKGAITEAEFQEQKLLLLQRSKRRGY